MFSRPVASTVVDGELVEQLSAPRTEHSSKLLKCAGESISLITRVVTWDF